VKREVTGILMEIGENVAVIMTKEGEFLKVKKPSSNTLPGEEITSTTVDKNRYSFAKYLSIAAAILILLITFTYYQQAMATVAYVNVDINPSIEMGINKYNKVNSITALNSEGEALVKDMPLKGLNINEALDMVIIGAKEKGYIAEDKQNNIEIALVKVEESNTNISEESLVKYAEDLPSKINVDATIKIQKTDKNPHDDAKKEKTSTNKNTENSNDKDKNAVEVKIKKDSPSVEKEYKKDDHKKDTGKDKTPLSNKEKNNNKDKEDNKKPSYKDRENKKNLWYKSKEYLKKLWYKDKKESLQKDKEDKTKKPKDSSDNSSGKNKDNRNNKK